jgi:type III pantothenate kinase
MTPNLVLAIDIGNTNTHTGLIDCEGLSCLCSDVFPSKKIGAGLAPSIESLIKKADQQRDTPVVVCNVGGTRKESISKLLAAAGLQSPIWFGHHKNFPVSVTYENIGNLGPDRLANCLYGFASHPGQSQIIIDAGTAITVDFLKNGKEFSGGTILPGITTQLLSLHEHTSALPSVDLDESATEFPGKSTKSSMMTGVTYGTAGALSFLVTRYKERFGSDAIVIAAGGVWKHVEKLVMFEFEYVPELTLIGTGLYWKLGRK